MVLDGWQVIGRVGHRETPSGGLAIRWRSTRPTCGETFVTLTPRARRRQHPPRCKRCKQPGYPVARELA